MIDVLYECPICKAEFSNPNELREHRLKEHKNIVREIRL
ncbi:MAG: C2H2-type zinc finger protein [Candidatus Bathyarchaeia archaeon]|jgi:DNA-directed RNA polymerase subunit RPC12/RpoP